MLFNKILRSVHKTLLYGTATINHLLSSSLKRQPIPVGQQNKCLEQHLRAVANHVFLRPRIDRVISSTQTS